MISKDLIERTQRNVEWLVDNKSDKGFAWRIYDSSELHFGFVINKERTEQRAKTTNILIQFINGNSIFVQPDDKFEFSNSIGRIFWEAWKDRIEIWRQYVDEIGYCYTVSFEKGDKAIILDSTEELSAQLEALCLRIEQERSK
jgi:hypothetical protein